MTRRIEAALAGRNQRLARYSRTVVNSMEIQTNHTGPLQARQTYPQSCCANGCLLPRGTADT